MSSTPTITPAAEAQLVATGILPEPIAAPEVKPAPSDLDNRYRELQEENKRLKAVIDANLNSRPTVAPASVKATLLADQVKARFGPVGFLKASRDEKLQGLGVDPKSTTDAYLLSAFGRGCDPTVGKELMRLSPQRYAQLRQAALLLNLYGG